MAETTTNTVGRFFQGVGGRGMSESIRLACLTCDREDCDGINEIPPGWEEQDI